ncbi:TetR/AcrR family transcriptional regulator [Leptospira sp. 96542]|nr:TetR/AcrR family transcriptional regulator [Leptospira sp. 96542]
MKNSNYHHGDLKNTILKTCHKLLKKHGSSSFTLRQVAEEIGVSHAAVYRHFKDKDEVLEILASTGFIKLAANQKKIYQTRYANPKDFFVKFGQVYIQFAIKNPNYYRLMFQTKRAKESKVLKQSKLKSYATLVHGCRYFLNAKNIKINHRSYAMMAWSLVHGYSNLCIETEFPKTEAKTLGLEIETMAEQILLHSLGNLSC